MLARLQENQRVTLKLSRPAGYTLFPSVLLFVILAAVLEMLARSTAVQAYIPFQAYGTNHIQFELQLRNLAAFIAQEGTPDCFILGNSQALRGVEPQLLAQAYQEETGEALLCYNFGVVGTNIATTFYFDKILIDKYHPQLVILGTNFLDYTQGRESRLDPRFEESAWIDYQLGEWSVEGWLLEHSYAFRLLTLFSYSAADGFRLDNLSKEIRKWDEQLTHYGYGYSDTSIDPEEGMTAGFRKNLLAELGDFSVSERNLASLEDIAKLGERNGIQVLIVEMPYHPSLLVLKDKNDQPYPQQEDLTQFVEQVDIDITGIAARNHVPYWTTSQLGIFPEDGWLDRYHLNAIGSQIFTQWLAEQIAAAVTNGQIARPSARH